MAINLNFNQTLTGLADKQYNEIVKLLKQIHMNQQEFAQELAGLKAQVDKANAEILAKITTLTQAIEAAGNITPEVQAALADLKASVQSTDDIVPDAEV